MQKFAQRSAATSGMFWSNPGRRVFLARQSYATPQSTPAGQTCWSKIDLDGDLCEFGSRKELSQGIKEFDLQKHEAKAKKISSTMTEFVSPGAPGNQLQFLDPLFELWANPVVGKLITLLLYL